MVRKNNPEKTKESIISVSTKLFLEKGYEKTSMQDIVEALGMSKGAIFHHFKSKEDIFNAVSNKQSEYREQTFYQWIEEMKGLSAKEKLIGFLERNLNDQENKALNSLLASQYQNPHFILANMQEAVNGNAPVIARILREGIEDGSITTDFPDECAELFFLLTNVWCDPLIFECDTTRLGRRLKFLQQMMKQMGVDIFSDELVRDYTKYIEESHRKESK